MTSAWLPNFLNFQISFRFFFCNWNSSFEFVISAKMAPPCFIISSSLNFVMHSWCARKKCHLILRTYVQRAILTCKEVFVLFMGNCSKLFLALFWYGRGGEAFKLSHVVPFDRLLSAEVNYKETGAKSKGGTIKAEILWTLESSNHL